MNDPDNRGADPFRTALDLHPELSRSSFYLYSVLIKIFSKTDIKVVTFIFHGTQDYL